MQNKSKMIFLNSSRPSTNSLVAQEAIGSQRGWRVGQPRLFVVPFNDHEHRAIHYILENLSTKNLMVLFAIQSKLKAKGDQLEHIHPLSFFMHILKNPTLKKYFHDLRRKNNRSWTEFKNGAIKSFSQEKAHQNIQDSHIEHFCTQTQKDPYHIRHLIHENRWTDLINHL